MAKNPSLLEQVEMLANVREQNGVDILTVADKCITRFAQHRDWDPLSRLIVLMKRKQQDARIGRIVRLRFGKSVSFKLDKTHSTGGKFTLHNWPAHPESFPMNNGYSLVRQAIKDGLSFDDKELTKRLDEVDPSSFYKKVKTVTEDQTVKESKSLAKKLGDLHKAGFDIGDLIRRAQATLAANKTEESTQAKPVRDATTGNIIDIPH